MCVDVYAWVFARVRPRVSMCMYTCMSSPNMKNMKKYDSNYLQDERYDLNYLQNEKYYLVYLLNEKYYLNYLQNEKYDFRLNYFQNEKDHHKGPPGL